MISYVTVGTNDFARAESFFDELLAELGASQAQKTERMIFWVGPEGGAALSVVKPLDGQAAAAGNGVMVALTAKDGAEVDRVYQKALSLGAADEGEPGIRASGFYCAYFRDLDGNKFNLFCPQPGE